MLLIRILDKDYTFSREAWADLIGSTRTRYYCTYDFASMHPSVFKFTEIKRPSFSPLDIDVICRAAEITRVPASYILEQLDELFRKEWLSRYEEKKEA